MKAYHPKEDIFIEDRIEAVGCFTHLEKIISGDGGKEVEITLANKANFALISIFNPKDL